MINALEKRIEEENPHRDWKKWIPIYGAFQDTHDSKMGKDSIVDIAYKCRDVAEYRRRLNISAMWALYHYTSVMSTIIAAEICAGKLLK